MVLARCLVALVVRCVAGNVWNLHNITTDLGCSSCTSTPAALIAAGGQTTCAADQIAVSSVTLGTCSSCHDQPKGPGYYCQSGEVILCPNGHYCPDYLQKIECPEKKWCREGFTSPVDCRPMVTCEKGSEKQVAGLGFIIGLLWMIGLCCCCSWCIGIRKIKAESAMKQAALEMQDHDVVLGADFVSDLPSLTIGFEDLSMTLKSNNKCVLDRITGQFPGASLVALMGPSGGGKTTFMNALCGRASYGNVTGKISVNGKEGGVTDFPRMVGFVPQDDIMHCDLTVHQNLYYNARLRMPTSVPYDKMLEHVNCVVKTLGLEKIAHNIVGSPERRGISGGQKKRVNIGMELAAMPAVIFMDEPTSGLDGAATMELATCLSNLRASGLTIVCVIHQPRYAVFAAFSHLLLLGAGGGQVYCGQTLGIDSYLTSLGFRCPPKENPADWMIDVVCGLSNRYGDGDKIDESFTAPTDLFKIWADKYKGKQTPYDGPATEVGRPLTSDRATPNVFWQTFLFLSREARKWNKASFVTTCIMLFTSGALFGMIMQSLSKFKYDSIMATLSGNGFLFYMICTINARGVFGFERLEYLREFSSGTSCVAYWLAKMIWNIINWYMYSLCYSLPLYWMMPVPAQGYDDFFWAFLWAGWYHLGLGMVLTVVFPNATTSLLMCVFVPMILQLAFSGDLTKIKDMNPSMLLLSCFSCGRWFKQTLFIRELEQYPAHTRNFPAVQSTLEDYDMKMSDGNVGIIWLFVVGLVLRLWTLCVLLLLKYSEGNTCVGRIVHLISKGLHKIGMSALITPKAGDTTDSRPVVQRKPSQLVCRAQKVRPCRSLLSPRSFAHNSP